MPNKKQMNVPIPCQRRHFVIFWDVYDVQREFRPTQPNDWDDSDDDDDDDDVAGLLP